MRRDLTGCTPHEVLKTVWGYDDFRPCQAEIIASVLMGRDTLGLMPTGGGKSLTFQVPALILPGVTIVITPLVSLMKDQVDNLAARGIRAVYLASGMMRREVTLAYDRIRLGHAKIIYVAPERLRSDTFRTMLRTWNVSLIVVDEAHCISQWGYDFRPSYLEIASLRSLVGVQVPFLALTASATTRVCDDIINRLGFRPDSCTFRLSFTRDNLSYIVRLVNSKESKLMEVLTNTRGSAIVYVRSRRKTGEIAKLLEGAGISAAAYHAGLDPEIKAVRQEAWKAGKVRVMVATNAFGMGIDKPDVRLVAHVDLPPSLEEYYQEAGRAGRDGLPSFAVLIATERDKATLVRRLSDSFPTIDYVRRVYELAGNFMNVAVGDGFNKVYEFDFEKFCTTFRLQTGPVRGALSLLSLAGYIEYRDEPSSRSRVMMTCNREELYSVNLTSDEDAVLMALLRRYSGLFADYVSISENMLGTDSGVGYDKVYDIMLSLARKDVLSYVPKRQIPFIYFPTSRELPRYVNLPDSIYTRRREMMESRLNAVRGFVYDSSTCRSQSLLRYFDEENVCECGKCDVCRRRRIEARQASAYVNVEQVNDAICRLASHPGGIRIDELCRVLDLPREVVLDAVRVLLEVEAVTMNGARIQA